MALIDTMMSRIVRKGCLVILQHDGTTSSFGAPAEGFPEVTIRFTDARVARDILIDPRTGAGEAFMDGRLLIETGDVMQLVQLLRMNQPWDRGGLLQPPRLLPRIRDRLAFVRSSFNRADTSKRNVAHHYDVGNDLYRLMLDDTMAYSCGIYLTEDATLREASIAKFDAVCRKLALTSSDHLVEIGTGWGGLAIHAAENYGCRVTTTTISREQHDFAKEKIAARGLSDRITLLFEDYRDLRGQFDKLVSIEMIEAVGARYLDTYFAKCSSLLKPTGAMMLQAITLQDQFYDKALKSVDYIQRFIFPGSFIPSVTAIADSVTRVTDMKLFNLEDIGPHYAPTLKAWRERFFANIDKVRALGYPESFNRLWEFYLCYCEGGFAERQLGNVQMLLTKPDCRRAAIAAG